MQTEHDLDILSFASPEIRLENAGGKGLHLAEMTSRGLPVPSGFIISTAAYRQFRDENRLSGVIAAAVKPIDPADTTALETASKTIRAAFTHGSLSDSIREKIVQAYRQLGAPAVAIRSSATAEDLPELSFAGQQDTYLNVNNETLLLQRVIDCWASLWTARAIGYRLRQGVGQQEIALAVVVQQMVQSEVSGVLFTANPLNGSRVETVIDATLGLGEALVSGLVDPDHYVVETLHNQIVQKTLGRKALSIRAEAEGGVKQVNESVQDRPALSDEQILELAQLGQRVQQQFDGPQDIEWAYCEGKLYLLQTRAITSLYPLPAGMQAEPLLTFVSFAAVQGLVDPITPIGQSSLKQIFALLSELFGVKTNETAQRVLFSAGERLWINFTPIISNSLGRKVLPYVFGMVEPTVKLAVDQISEDPRLQPKKKGVSLHARRQMAMFLIPVAGKVFLNLLAPAPRRHLIVAQGEAILKIMEEKAAAIQGDRYQKLAQRATLMQEVARAHLGGAFKLFVSGVAAGMASWNALRTLTKAKEDAGQFHWGDLVLEVTRGMPHNPTTEMDLRLWKMAKEIRKDPAALKAVTSGIPAELSRQFLAGDLPETLLDEVRNFLDQYGGRGLGEIDLGRTRWAEEPTHVFEMLVNFAKIENENDAPDAVFERGKERAEEAIRQLTAQVRQSRGGWFKARRVHFFARRARQLMGLRENPKFFVVRLMWIVHRELKQSGQEFVAAGELQQADDLFYLTFPELSALAAGEKRDWQGLIRERRSQFEREMKRRQLPRLFLSDGRAFYEGMADRKGEGQNTIMGSPVSPGVVEGRVRVVLDPGKANLVHGEILVCPGTDPSWTPLFLLAGGLAMEVGGMMTHGAVVAREYGIPAVVGVSEAITRLKTGMLIRLNGSTGEITILED